MSTLLDVGIDPCLKPRPDSRFHSFTGTSFAGVPMAQKWVDLIAWETILNENGHVNGIVEIGTFKGGFSLYLSAQARARGMFFRTYDVFDPEMRIPGFVKIDVFAYAEDVGSHLRHTEPVILFCDGGNKGRELKTFSKYLSPRSLIMVHDWDTEFFGTQVPENVAPAYEEFLTELGSPTRAFRVKEEI